MCPEKKKRILLVDDDAVTMMMVSNHLRLIGYDVLQALSGEEAVETVKINAGGIDLILMDVDLGDGMDGIQTAKFILEKEDIPVVFVSAHTESEIVEKTEQVTSYGYVVKNSGIHVLDASIRMAFRLHEAHRRLQESEARYRSLVENVPLGMFRSSPEGKFYYVNNALVKMLRYDSPEDLIDSVNRTSIAEAVYEDPGRRPLLVEEVERKGGQWKTYENRYRRKDGNIFDAMLIFGEARDNETGQNYLMGFVQDIATLKRLEREVMDKQARLLASNQIMSAILEHTHIMAVYLDADFNFIWVNHAYAETCRQEPSFFPGKNHFDLYPDDENRVIFQGVVDSGEPFYVEAKPFTFPDQPERGITWWDWSLVPVKNEKGAVAGLVFTLAEVTERKKNEFLKELAVERLNSLVELAGMDETPSGEVADFVLDKIVSLTGSTIGFLGFIDDDETEMTVHAWSKNAMAECSVHDKTLLFNIEQSGIWAEAVKQGKVIIINDYSADHPGKKGIPEGHVKLERLISVPWFYNGHIVAVAAVANKTEYYNEADVQMVTLLMDGMFQINRRRENERKLQVSEEKYRTVANFTQDWEYWADPEGTMIYNSPSFMDITGYGPDDFTGLMDIMKHIVHPEDRDHVMEHSNWSLTPGEKMDYGTMDFRIIHRDGRVVWIGHRCRSVYGQDGSWLGVRGSNREITLRKNIEHEQKKTMEHLQALFEALPDLMFELDMEGRFINYHARDDSILFRQPNEFLGKTIEEVMPAGILPGLHEMFRKVRENGVFSGLTCLLDIPPGPTWYELSASLSGRPDSPDARIIVLARDISERKAGEKALSDALEENRALLRELQHRVKNSLTMISSLIILEGTRAATPEVEAAMKNLDIRVKILTDLYGMLYESGRVGELRTDLYIARLCDSIAKVYGTAKPLIGLSMDEVSLTVKRTSVAGLILNELVTNSIKHGKETAGGVRIDIGLKRRGDSVELSVSDNGPGLPAGFDMMQNQGLGLRLIEMLTRQLKGELSWSSGENTVFTIRFPLAS